MEALKRWLGGRGLALWAAALGSALSAPSLWSGLQTEDHMHADAIRRGTAALPWSPNLFAYNDGNVQTIYTLKDVGTIPWLALENYKISFWRPLASYTHHLDHRLWPDSPVAMHVHSLLWLAVVVALVALLYRRLIRPLWAAGLATLLYAVDDAHGHAIGWIANRNSLIATVFGVACIIVFDRWRRDGWRPGVVLAPLLLALGLASGELAAGALAYLIAHAMFLDRAPVSRRVLALTPCLVVTAAWLVVYRQLGHGTHGSGLYIHPLSEPGAYLRETLWRLPALLSGLFAAPPADEWNYFAPETRRYALGGFAAGLALVGWLLAPLFKRSPSARFWAAGLVVSLLPACATFPSDRLLFFGGLGAMALVATLVAGFVEKAPWVEASKRRVAAGVVAVASLGVHAVLAPARLPTRVRTMETVGGAVDAASKSALEGQAGPDQLLVLVNAPSFYVGSLMVGVPLSRGEPVPRHTRVLFGGHAEVAVTRLDAQTLLLRSDRGFLTDPLDRVYRGRNHPLEPGNGLMLTATLAIVREVTADGSPRAVSFQFRAPLEDRGIRFMKWNAGRYEPFEPPPIGQSVVLPAAAL